MAAGPLNHIRVLDLSRVLAGPWCTQILGDLGADVIKVEHPEGGDDTRHWGPPFVKNPDGTHSDACYFLCANANKRSIAINLAHPEGQEIVRKLAAQSDVVVENFKTGGLKKYGLDYEGLKEVRDDIIYCSITGFGQTGPLAHQPGYDFLIQAMSGLMSITGHDRPTKVGIPLVDLFTGVYAANAIQAALIARDRGQGGRHIDMALFDVQMAVMANQASNVLNGHMAPGMNGNGHPNIVPYQDFQTQDGRIAITVGSDRQFEKFATALGHPDWASDVRFKINESRVENRDILIPLIEKVLAAKACLYWQSALEKAGVPCGPVQDMSQAFAMKQVIDRNIVERIERNDDQKVELVKDPLNQTFQQDRKAPPRFGEHTDEIILDVLKCDDSALNRWKNENILR